MTTKFKIPKTLGACADALYKLREQRLALQKEVDALRKHQTELEDYIVEALPKSNASGVSGKVANVRVTTSAKPVVEDWDAFYKHVKKTGAFELLQRRLNEKSIEERWDAKKVVPGVGTFSATKVSCTKV